MSIQITNFEKQLLQKIQQKSNSKLSLDTFLFKNFKFFDLNQSGALTKSDFFRAIAKCGVAVPPSNIDGIFSYYSEGSDKISYHHFIEEFVGREGELISNSSRLNMSQKSKYDPLENKSISLSQVSQGKQDNSPQGKSKKMVVVNNYTDLLGHIKATLQEQGLGSLTVLASKLKTTDKGKTHRISTMKLFSTLPFLTMDHLNIIADELSEGKDNIDYSLLVYDLKGEINEDISSEIANTFYFLDTKREGEILIDYLLSRFLSRSLEAKFRRAVESYSIFQGITDGVFTEDDFNDFLGFLSFDYSLSEQFKSQVIRAFYDEDNRSTTSQKSNRTRDFQGTKNQKGEGSQVVGDFRKEKVEKKSTTEEIEEDDHFHKFKQDLDDKDEKKSVSRYSKYQGHELQNSRMSVFQSVIQRIKKRLASKGTKGFLILQKSLKNADLNQDTLLTVDQFIQVIKDQRIDITLTQCNSIFDLFDNQGTGLISFPQFMFTIRGQMPAFRRELVNKLWLQVKLNGEQTSLSKIRHSLNFRIHPDVQAGRRYEDDIWKQIQDTVFLIQQLNGRARGDTVLRGDFDEYMQNLSLSVLDDRLFESILLNFWRLDNSLSILQKYAGSRKLFDQSKNGYLMDHHRNYIKGGSVSENAPFGTFKETTTYTTEHKRL